MLPPPPPRLFPLSSSSPALLAFFSAFPPSSLPLCLSSSAQHRVTSEYLLANTGFDEAENEPSKVTLLYLDIQESNRKIELWYIGVLIEQPEPLDLP